MSEQPKVVIKGNNAGTNDPCAICGKRTDPIVGPEFFLAGTSALVCHDCAAKYSPDMVEAMQAFKTYFDVSSLRGLAPSPWGTPDVEQQAGEIFVLWLEGPNFFVDRYDKRYFDLAARADIVLTCKSLDNNKILERLADLEQCVGGTDFSVPPGTPKG